MHLCKWDNLDQEISHLTDAILAGKTNSDPFGLLSLKDAPDDHLQCARAWIAKKYPQSSKPIRSGEIYNHNKIRLGYASADLHKHATAYLMAELFELHDKTRFETIAFSFGPDDQSEIRSRLVNSFGKFVECRGWSDSAIAEAVAKAEIDILIDLKGFVQDARTNIFASRPAPIQVNYLGYPGTMGASYIDYIIGDNTLFALHDAVSYTEKLVRLPHTYQPNDRKRMISDKLFSRGDVNLPDDVFVFCSFNNNRKITPATFDSWMRILTAVERSVLWCFTENQTAIHNLRREAEGRGVDPNRLVFAERIDLEEHLARHRLADLFLDTLPYNAHTTASDALWAGLPILTLKGNSFAGRVAASLLNAVGLPELITHSREEYEAWAIDLALNKQKLQAIRDKLQRNRLTTPLFDTALYTKHLEAAYEAMYQLYQEGLPPDHIEVKPIQ